MLAWARDREGRRVHVGELEPARRRERAPFACLGCAEPLVARLGQQRARHFAHPPGSTCALTHPESALHRNAKERLLWLCAEAFAGRLRVTLGARCPACRRLAPLDLGAAGDGAVEEAAAGTLRPDVLVTRGGAPALAFEVRVSHAVDAAKELALAALALPTLEIDAREPWEEERSGQEGEPPGLTLKVSRSLGVPPCGSCQATARADLDRAAGGEAAALAELESYRARGLMGTRPGTALAAEQRLDAADRRALKARFRCPACASAALTFGRALARHACPGEAARPVAWRGYDGALVELSWWRRPPRRGTP